VLESLRAGIHAYCQRHGIEARARVLGDFGLALYVVVKHPSGDLAAMERVYREHVASLEDDRFAVHRNGNNISIVPRAVSKESAVRFLIETYAAGAITIGLGDSLSDAAFLAACDFGMLPRGSQLFQSLVSRAT
jgi:hydroxymethylpyrimidine pyrophosphatase-like HAD family hydrolase